MGFNPKFAACSRDTFVNFFFSFKVSYWKPSCFLCRADCFTYFDSVRRKRRICSSISSISLRSCFDVCHYSFLLRTFGMKPARIIWSARVIATAASTAGTALGTTHGSCLPPTFILALSILDKFTVCCSFAMDGVGFMATRIVMGIPEEMPPSMPPARFVAVKTLPFCIWKASLASEPSSL